MEETEYHGGMPGNSESGWNGVLAVFSRAPSAGELGTGRSQSISKDGSMGITEGFPLGESQVGSILSIYVLAQNDSQILGKVRKTLFTWLYRLKNITSHRDLTAFSYIIPTNLLHIEHTKYTIAKKSRYTRGPDCQCCAERRWSGWGSRTATRLMKSHCKEVIAFVCRSSANLRPSRATWSSSLCSLCHPMIIS